jgi:serine/threonine protein kinase
MDDICLIDFGEVFKVSEPPEDLGIPTAYCSPELLLDKKAGVPSDIWALACTIFEIISGEPLFPDQFGDGQDVIIQWVQLLGRMPDEWWETWEARATFFDEEGSPLDEKAMKTSFEGIFEEGLTVMEGINRVKKTLKVPQSERGQLADLLSKILRYDPKERPTVEEILKHDYWKSKIGQV